MRTRGDVLGCWRHHNRLLQSEIQSSISTSNKGRFFLEVLQSRRLGSVIPVGRVVGTSDDFQINFFDIISWDFCAVLFNLLAEFFNEGRGNQTINTLQ